MLAHLSRGNTDYILCSENLTDQVKIMLVDGGARCATKELRSLFEVQGREKPILDKN